MISSVISKEKWFLISEFGVEGRLEQGTWGRQEVGEHPGDCQVTIYSVQPRTSGTGMQLVTENIMVILRITRVDLNPTCVTVSPLQAPNHHLFHWPPGSQKVGYNSLPSVATISSCHFSFLTPWATGLLPPGLEIWGTPWWPQPWAHVTQGRTPRADVPRGVWLCTTPRGGPCSLKG